LRKYFGDFLVTHERFAAHERHVDRAIRVNQRHDSVHEFFPAKVTDLTKYGASAEMLVAVGITARAG
jgi:hypothetical protein